MSNSLLIEIESFISFTGIGEHRFGILAASNGRLVERLRAGRRVWPDTEQKVREFISAERARRSSVPSASQTSEPAE